MRGTGCEPHHLPRPVKAAAVRGHGVLADPRDHHRVRPAGERELQLQPWAVEPFRRRFKYILYGSSLMKFTNRRLNDSTADLGYLLWGAGRAHGRARRLQPRLGVAARAGAGRGGARRLRGGGPGAETALRRVGHGGAPAPRVPGEARARRGRGAEPLAGRHAALIRVGRLAKIGAVKSCSPAPVYFL